MDYQPMMLKPLSRDDDGRTVMTFVFDDRLAYVWGKEAVREAKQQIVAAMVEHVMTTLKNDHERTMQMVIDGLADAIKEQIASAVAAKLMKDEG